MNSSLACEFATSSIVHKREVALSIVYKGHTLSSAYRADFVKCCVHPDRKRCTRHGRRSMVGGLPVLRRVGTAAGSNRRIRKTVRPVVWEGAGAQSPVPDPIAAQGRNEGFRIPHGHVGLVLVAPRWHSVSLFRHELKSSHRFSRTLYRFLSVSCRSPPVESHPTGCYVRNRRMTAAESRFPECQIVQPITVHLHTTNGSTDCADSRRRKTRLTPIHAQENLCESVKSADEPIPS